MARRQRKGGSESERERKSDSSADIGCQQFSYEKKESEKKRKFPHKHARRIFFGRKKNCAKAADFLCVCFSRECVCVRHIKSIKTAFFIKLNATSQLFLLLRLLLELINEMSEEGIFNKPRLIMGRHLHANVDSEDEFKERY